MLAASSAFPEQKGGRPPKASPPPSPPRVNNKANNPRPTPAGRGPAAGGPHLPNPLTNPVQRMMAMPQEQRERILEKLPAQQQANIRQRLEAFDRLPPAEKARRLQLYQRFSDLPPAQQQVLGRQLPAFNRLPEERRTALGKELLQLSDMPESERQVRLNSEELKSRFSSSELQMLSDISASDIAPYLLRPRTAIPK